MPFGRRTAQVIDPGELGLTTLFEYSAASAGPRAGRTIGGGTTRPSRWTAKHGSWSAEECGACGTSDRVHTGRSARTGADV